MEPRYWSSSAFQREGVCAGRSWRDAVWLGVLIAFPAANGATGAHLGHS